MSEKISRLHLSFQHSNKSRNKSKQGSRSSLLKNSISNCRKIHQLQQQLEKTSKRYQHLISQTGANDYHCQLEVYDTLHEGPFSIVHKVRHKQECKNYALKKISPLLFRRSNEHNISKGIRSHFIVDVKDAYCIQKAEGPEGAILMKLYQFDLQRVIEGKLSLDKLTIKIILYQMVRGVHYLHMKGISHRDIRPSNFMVDFKGRILLGDLGLAIRTGKSDLTIGQIGGIAYRAPELHLGCKKYSQTVDIWALGCVAIQLLSGVKIFDGSGTIDCLLNIGKYMGTAQLKKLEKQSQLVRLMPNLDGKGLKKILKNCEPSCLDLVEKMLAVDPQKRIATIDILVHSYFDELKDEQTYDEIMAQRCDISNFFDFQPIEVKNYQQYMTRLIPFWKREKNNFHNRLSKRR